MSQASSDVSGGGARPQPGPPAGDTAPARRASSLLEVEGLVTQIRLRTRTVHAVDGVSFEVRAGETLGLVGESGCGKTMTGMSIMRLLPPGGRIAAGRIVFDGRDLAAADLSLVRAIRGNEIGMVFQDPMTSLNPTMPIGRQIASPVRLHRGVSRKAAMARAAEVLALVGMPRPAERLEDYPHQLSGGLRQRAMIAMALACEPKLLIADEPTTALDVTIQAQILDLLERLKSELDMAMILITHDMGVIAGRTDRVMVMYAGKIVETASTEALFEEMRHPYTEALLASIPRLDHDKSLRLYSIPGMPPELSGELVGCRFAPRCAFATELCRAEEPLLVGAVGAHHFACYHPRGGSDAVAIAGGADDAGVAVAGAGSVAVALAADVGAAVAGVAAASPGRTQPAGAAQAGERPGGPVGRPEVILEFRAVSKEFPVTSGGLLQRKIGRNHAVSEVSLAVRRGETFGLVGESGCGKSTLGRMAVALEVPTAGEVLFGGTDLFSLGRGRLKSVRRGLQLMFQDPYASLDPRMHVGEIIAEPLAVRGTESAKQRNAIVHRLLDEVGLAPSAASRYPHEFSGGQRQRIGLARALALNPALIVADEPVSALDVSIRSQILNLMRRLQSAHGLTYVVISHDLSVVRYLADDIGVMYLGRLVEVGPADAIYAEPAHPYTRALLDAIPVPDPAIERHKQGIAVRGEMPSAMNPPSGCRFRTRCPRATELCAEEAPQLRPFAAGQLAACHFPLRQPASDPGAPTGTGV